METRGHVWAGMNVLSVEQFNRDMLGELFLLAERMRNDVERCGGNDLMRGKVLANVFYEPSTRTSCSFSAAMQRMGGGVLQINETSSSIAKGETLQDTVRCLECYADVLVLRHPVKGSAKAAAGATSKPLLNAGDGVGEHPTQALLDAFTITSELGSLDGITVTMVGDLKHGRTVHSLARLLSLFSVKLNYVSPAALSMPDDVQQEVAARGIEQRCTEVLDEVLAGSDVLYVTRVQKERFESVEEYERLKHAFVITPDTLRRAKPKMIVMHPLPRVGEISEEVDTDPRAAYFRQMTNGMYVRMALLALVTNARL